MKGKLHILVSIALLLLVASAATAQDSTPQLIKLQGFLSDSSGGSRVPANGTFSMTFDLFDTDLGGLLIASVGPLNVDVTDGFYSVELAFVPTHFGSTERYIEITVNGEMLSPRVSTRSVPFAYNAETLDGLEGSDFALSNVVVGLQEDVDTLSSDTAAHETAADPHLDYVLEAGDVMSGSLQVAETLTVRGAATRSRLELEVPSNGPATKAEIAFTVDGATEATIQYNEADGRIKFKNQGNSAEVMVFDGDRVGIGTAIPNAKLDIHGSLLVGNPIPTNELVLGVDGPVNINQSSGQGNMTGRPALRISQNSGLAYPDQTALEIVAGPSSDQKVFRVFTEDDPYKLKAALDGSLYIYQSSVPSQPPALHIYQHSAYAGPNQTAFQVTGGVTDISPKYFRIYTDGGDPWTLKASFDGRLTTEVLEITGGADIAEPFPMTAYDRERVEAGAVLVIDETNPGHLRLSTEAYDRRVAGVVSGAGGIQPGLTLGQSELLGHGPPTAVSGRVYCRATASNGPIRPGDLLTTSDLPGHAMKVRDHKRSQGAVMGKAMSRLDQGEGLVLLLVSLQ